MKAFFVAVLFCLFSYLSIAQVNCDSVRKENAYLRKALSLNEPLKEAKNGSLTFSIVKVTGDSKAQSVTIEVLIRNSGKNLESFGSKVESVSDLNGNIYKLFEAYVGNEKIYSSMHKELFRDAPIRCRYIFKGIEPEVKMIKLFNYPVKYHVPGTNSFDFVEENAEFRDFAIAWK